MQDAFLETISCAVLRHLVGACRKFETQACREHETIFVSNVHNAVKYVCDDKHYRSLCRRDVDQAKEWQGDLNFLYKRMQQVAHQYIASPSCCLVIMARFRHMKVCMQAGALPSR